MKFRSYSLVVIAASLIGGAALADTTPAAPATVKSSAAADKPEMKQEMKQSQSAKTPASSPTTAQAAKTGDKKADTKVTAHQHTKEKAATKTATAKIDAPVTGTKVSSAAKTDSTVKTK
jgi:hypothetical protein